MKRLLMIATCLLVALPSKAQTPDPLLARLDSLVQVRQTLQTRLTWLELDIEEVELDIEEVEAELARIEFEQLSAEGIEIGAHFGGKLRPESKAGPLLGTIPNGTRLRAKEFINTYWRVVYDGQAGYVSDAFVKQTEATERFKAASAGTTGAGPGATPPSPCCKICRKGKACGDSCIARNKTCRKGPGCACNG